jgi:molybdopterin-guanine dinucleotide biosynthesis protein A
MIEKNLTIGILAGGNSRRFNQDKTLKIFQGKSLIEWTILNAQNISNNIYILAKDTSKYQYLGYPILLDKSDESTPINGIISITPYVKSWLLLLASDTPFFTKKVLNLLYNSRQKGYANLFKINGRLNPFIALYPKSLLDVWTKAKNSGERQLTKIIKDMPKTIISEEEVREIDPDLLSFTNINTREDLIKYERKIHKAL